VTKRKYIQRLKTGHLYFRANGKTIERLPDDESSIEFARAYDRLIGELGVGKHGGKPRPGGRPSTMIRPRPDTAKLIERIDGREVYRPPAIGWVIEQWLCSDFFARPDTPDLIEKPYAADTQYNYRKGLDLMREEGMAAVKLTDLNPRNATLYIDRIKKKHRSASCASLQKALLSNLWRFAKTLPEIDLGAAKNPMRDGDVPQPYSVRQEHKDWPADVQQRYLAACSDPLALAFHLLLCTGQRVSDVIKMKWADYDGTHIQVVQKKTKARLTIRAPKMLQDILGRTPRRGDHLLLSHWGKPYTRSGLSHQIKRVLREVGAGDYTVHGLRKNTGIILALNGGSVPLIRAQLGHQTDQMASYYVRLANQRMLADQAADLLDQAFADQAKQRRAAIRRVK
jgi:integrase